MTEVNYGKGGVSGGYQTGAGRRPDFRNRKIAKAYAQGDTTYEKIGKAYGITRERVRQIVAREARRMKKKSTEINLDFSPTEFRKPTRDLWTSGQAAERANEILHEKLSKFLEYDEFLEVAKKMLSKHKIIDKTD